MSNTGATPSVVYWVQESWYPEETSVDTGRWITNWFETG